MWVIIFVNCDSLAFADGRGIAELSDVLHRLAERVRRFQDLEQIDEPLTIRDSRGDAVGRLAVTADAE
jgi:hypothetical protein